MIQKSFTLLGVLAHNETPNLAANLNEMNQRTMRSLCLLLLTLFATFVCADDFTGKKSKWMGFDRYDFTVDGRRCWIVVPEEAAPKRPWVWRARFFGHEPQADVALLKKGFHLAYCDVAGLFGSPKAVSHWNAFHKRLTEKHGLNQRPALEGMSRGGLIIFNWAAANPGKVSCIYADAPVCDFKSWPGGFGKGKGREADFRIFGFHLLDPDLCINGFLLSSV